MGGGSSSSKQTTNNVTNNTQIGLSDVSGIGIGGNNNRVNVTQSDSGAIEAAVTMNLAQTAATREANQSLIAGLTGLVSDSNSNAAKAGQYAMQKIAESSAPDSQTSQSVIKYGALVAVAVAVAFLFGRK